MQFPRPNAVAKNAEILKNVLDVDKIAAYNV